VVDLQDSPAALHGLRGPKECALYFKRSWATRVNGTSVNAAPTAAAAAARLRLASFPPSAIARPSWFRPLPFSTMRRYFGGPKALPHSARPIAVACLLRPHSALHFDESRARVLR